LIALLAGSQGQISEQASDLIEVATLITFMVSPYLIVLRYPTPIAANPKLRRN
jgi:hypothetical protein